MSLSPEDIKTIVQALQDSEWDEAVITIGDSTISLARNGATLTPTGEHAPSAEPAASSTAGRAPEAPAKATATEAPTSAAETPAATPAPAPQGAESTASTDVTEASGSSGHHVVAAPSVGVLWRSPEPGAAPFASIGDRLEIGDTICIVEIMKLMNNVATPVAGVLTAVHVENGGSVQAGDPMFSIRQD